VDLGLIVFFLQVVLGLVVVDALLSWVQSAQAMPRRLTRQLTEPLYAPIHAVIDPQKMGGLDLSPIVVIVIIQFLIGALS